MATTKVNATHIIGTDVVIVSAWEPLDGHHTQMAIDGRAMGKIGTQSVRKLLSPERTNLPTGEEVSEFHNDQYDRAYAAILEEYPRLGTNEGIGSRRSMGEITTMAGKMAELVETT